MYVCMYVCMNACVSVPACLSVFLCVCLLAWLPTVLCVVPYVALDADCSVCLPAWLSLCLSAGHRLWGIHFHLPHASLPPLSNRCRPNAPARTSPPPPPPPAPSRFIALLATPVLSRLTTSHATRPPHMYVGEC